MRKHHQPAWVWLAFLAAALLGVLVWLGPGAPPGGGSGHPLRGAAAPHRQKAGLHATPPRSGRPSPPDAGAGEGRPEGPAEAPGAPPGPRLAVVIDDVGYEIDPVRELLALGTPLSFAVIPHQRYSRRAAQIAYERGQEVLVHLPMEPLEYPLHDPGQGALLSTMDKQEMRTALRQALRSVPHARGLNNHMGSRLTADPEAMRLLMQELARRHLYFLDSRTTRDSVALTQARGAHVPCLERHVFLDARPERGFIEAQLGRATERARQQGSAVAICHPRPGTLEVLRRELPRLRERGVTLVLASELAS